MPTDRNAVLVRTSFAIPSGDEAREPEGPAQDTHRLNEARR
jgi:hypothetical protein